MNKTEEMAFLHPVQEVWEGSVRGCEWRKKVNGCVDEDLPQNAGGRMETTV